jgi:YegS/Rv2252/BmrU family lipid kinase
VLAGSDVRRLLIIFNPTAGWRRRRRLAAVLRLLRARGCALTMRPNPGPGDATRLAAEAVPERYDVVVAAGGDGTINEIINGLPEDAPALALIPLGTANVLAAERGLRGDPESIALTVASGQPGPVTLGAVNGRRFALMAGVGFDAHVVQTVDLRLKRWLGRAAYGVAIVRQLLVFGFPHYRVETDQGAWQAASVLVANARFYGGRFVCAPAASLTSPTLQVCLFERRGRLAAVGYALAMFAGFLPKLASYRTLPARRVEISGPLGDPIQVDGDIAAHLDAVIEVLPAALVLMYPPRQRAT